jgi:hypothetical protein
MVQRNYELWNSNGCRMEIFNTTSIKKARDYFESAYTGNYRIVWFDENAGIEKTKNVRFK